MTENKWLTIKKHHTHNYFYAERLGVHSVAFILADRNRPGLFGLIREFKPPIDMFLTTAFGGSIDKDKELQEIVIDEVKEEAGYTGELTISPLDSLFVSTQMNQFCHLYLVDITDATEVSREPDSYLEQQATVEWLSIPEILRGYCWKAITILTLTRKI